MPTIIPKKSNTFRLPKKVDDFLTNYLRNTTTDQEILDFYGEGNIIGRKGIPDNLKQLLDDLDETRIYNNNRPYVKRILPESEDLMGGLSGGENRLVDMPQAVNPATGRPYQLLFETLPFPGDGSQTPAAQRFLSDFRVPFGQTIDYGFEISPNVEDVKQSEINELLKDPFNYKNRKAAYDAIDAGNVPRGELSPNALEKIEEIKGHESGIRRFSGRMATPSVWQSRGFELPAGLKESTLDTFKNLILEQEQPFGSVSQLTPVIESYENVRPGGDPNWRANLYEKRGFAGPLTEASVKGAYGPSTANVQMFTRGSDRLLPIQPYTEFLNEFDASKPSALGTKPAPDFTPFQKAIGTRNYLIGRNILEGRGGLGKGFRAATAATAVPLAGKLAGFLGPIGDAFDFSEGISSALNPKNTTGERVAGGVQATGAGYGLAALGTTLAGGAALPAALPIAVGTGVTAGSIRAAEAMKNPAIRMADVPSFRKAMPAVSTKGFNRNDPIPPGKAVAILNGKPILVDKGSIAGNKKVGRPWWDAGQYFGR